MHTTTIPITLQLSIVLPDGVTLAPQVLTESDAWRYADAPAGGVPRSGDLSPRELPTAPPDHQPDAERKAELDQFLASLPKELPAGAGANEQDMQFVGNLLRGQLQEDIDRRAAATISNSADGSGRETSRRAQAHGSVAPQDATSPAVSDDAANASVKTDATNTTVIPNATDTPAAADHPRFALIARLHAANQRLEAEVRQLRDELTRALAAAVTGTARRASAPRGTEPGRREQSAAPQSTAPQSTAPQSTAPRTEPAQSSAPPKEDFGDPFAIKISHQSIFTLDGVEVPPHKRTAAFFLVGGATFNEAGRKAGVSRKTVHLWKRADPAFQAAYNIYRNEIWEKAEAKLHAGLGVAATNYMAQVYAGNFRASEKLLKGCGMLSGKPRQHACESAGQLAARESTPAQATEPVPGATRHELNGHAGREKVEV